MTHPHRRLPRLAGTRSRPARLLSPDSAEAEQAPVVEIAALIEQVCAIGHLNPFVVISDWVGMAEAAMRRQTLNLKTYTLTGHFAPDPPEVAEIFAGRGNVTSPLPALIRPPTARCRRLLPGRWLCSNKRLTRPGILPRAARPST
ncbi:MAG: hypothetical protein U0401_20260 [Anaerolineae bacterium]